MKQNRRDISTVKMRRYHYHFVIFGTILATLIYPLGVCVLVLGEQIPSVWIYLECLYYLVLYYLFPWDVVSLYLRDLWLIVLVCLLLWKGNWVVVAIITFLLVVVSLLSYKKTHKSSIYINNPSNHRLYVLQGGYSKLLNHHWNSLSQRFAVDLVGINHLGRRALGLFPKSLEDYICYGADVISPIDGVVVHAESHHKDHAIGEFSIHNPFGNMIIIEDEKGYQLVFAHLLQNSVSLSKGDYVKHGQVIGQIGNSGNTTEPHLHIHAQTIVKGEIHGVPLCIGKRNAIRNRVID